MESINQERKLYKLEYYHQKPGPKICPLCHMIERPERQKNYHHTIRIIVKEIRPTHKCHICRNDLVLYETPSNNALEFLRIHEALITGTIHRREMDVNLTFTPEITEQNNIIINSTLEVNNSDQIDPYFFNEV